MGDENKRKGANSYRRRESEGSEVLRSPDPVVSELEISWTSGEREELDCTNREIDEDVMASETPWIRWKKENLPPECL
jgi:hypothetical protein